MATAAGVDVHVDGRGEVGLRVARGRPGSWHAVAGDEARRPEPELLPERVPIRTAQVGGAAAARAARHLSTNIYRASRSEMVVIRL